MKFDPRYNVAILISSQFTLITSLNIVSNNSSNITLMMKSLLTIALLLVTSPAASACGSKEVRLTTVDNQQASLRISASNYSGSARELMNIRRFPRPGVQGDYSVHETFQIRLQTKFSTSPKNKIIRTLSFSQNIIFEWCPHPGLGSKFDVRGHENVVLNKRVPSGNLGPIQESADPRLISFDPTRIIKTTKFSGLLKALFSAPKSILNTFLSVSSMHLSRTRRAAVDSGNGRHLA